MLNCEQIARTSEKGKNIKFSLKAGKHELFKFFSSVFLKIPIN